MLTMSYQAANQRKPFYIITLTVRAKLLIQELWRKQVSWDEPLYDDFNSKWCQIATDIEEAAKTVMPRRYSVMSTDQCVYLHVFADASMKAYGAVEWRTGRFHNGKIPSLTS